MAEPCLLDGGGRCRALKVAAPKAAAELACDICRAQPQTLGCLRLHVTWYTVCACEHVGCSALQVVVVYPEDEVDNYIALADAIEDAFPELQVY